MTHTMELKHNVPSKSCISDPSKQFLGNKQNDHEMVILNDTLIKHTVEPRYNAKCGAR